MSIMDYIMTRLMLLSERVSCEEKDEDNLYQVMLRHEMKTLQDLVDKFSIKYNREINLEQFKRQLEKLEFDFENWGVDCVQISYGTKNQKINIEFDNRDGWKVVPINNI